MNMDDKITLSGFANHALRSFALTVPNRNKGFGVLGHLSIANRPCGAAMLLPLGWESLDGDIV